MAVNAPICALPRPLPRLAKVFDETFPVIVMADMEGVGLMANLLETDDRSVRNRLFIQRDLWVARRCVFDDPQTAADLIEDAIFKLGEEQDYQKRRGALHDELLALLHRIAEHWRSANARLERLWLALKGGGDG
jgi:hypothetical protein